MVNVPFRELAAKGVLRDPAPYQLDSNAWSRANNVRFHGNGAERGAVFRTIQDGLPFTPSYCYGYQAPTGYDTVYVTSNNARIYQCVGGVATDVTFSGWAANTDPRAWTGTFLADVLYLNQPGAQPTYFGPTSTQFQTLPGWSSTWTCRSLRGFQDYLVALNVTKGAVAYPNMVKWSDLALAGLPPGTWDQTNQTTNAGENILEEIDTPLLDSGPLSNVNILYAQNQVWSMTPQDNEEIFSFTRIFGDRGILAPNCWAEVAGKHYVLGNNDIYVHDGITSASIVDERNKMTIFRYLNLQDAELAFVKYWPLAGEVLFAYSAADPDAAFPPNGLGCNRGFLYSVGSDTGTFVDLPYVTAATLANANSGLTYSTCGTLTYATAGGSPWSSEGSYARVPMFASVAAAGVLTNSRLLAWDFYSRGTLSFPLCTEGTAPPLVEKTGIDLDQLGSDLGSAKLARRMFPQVVLYSAEAPITVTVGSSMTPAGPITWTAPISFDPVVQYKVDFRRAGRYLAVRFTAPATSDFSIPGFDLDIVPWGSR